MDYIPRYVLDNALHRLGRSAISERLYAMRALSSVRGMRYVDDAGKPRTIAVALKPWVLTSEQLLFFHHIAKQLADALLKLPNLRANIPSVRSILQFEPAREEWLSLCAHPKSRPLAVVGRLDSTAIYDHAHWKEDFRMLEPNTVGVGGIHYAPAGCSVVLDVLEDVLTGAFPGRSITAVPDPRQLLVDELRSVARRLHRPLKAVALIENTDFTTGTDEFQELAGYLNRRGIKAVVADPRELRIVRGKLSARGLDIDLLYRDSELEEFVDMESKGHRLVALRQAVKEGRLISGLTWEFDQKSAWEIFTDERYSRYFSHSQRSFFKKHVLWTRLVRNAKVSDPNSRAVDLVPFIRRNKEHLVLKPNTLFGGEGVTIGKTVSQGEWERTLHLSLRGKQRYVVQKLARISTDSFPILKDNAASYLERCVVSGFFFNSFGISLVGRFSGLPVVNVSRGGGLICALWVH